MQTSAARVELFPLNERGTGRAFHDSRELGTIPGKAFADLVFANFLGEDPLTKELKQGLLGTL